MAITIPTWLTLFRIITIPVMVAAFYWPHPQGHIITTAVFVLGALTDWLDGWIARRFNMGSAFGAFLDPVADKLAVVITLFIIVQRHHTVYMALLAAVIVGREITISALREWMAQIGASRSVAVHMIGKLKTTVQMIAIPFLLYHGTLFGVIDTQLWGTWLIWISAVLTVWSMVYYLQKAIPEIRARTK